MSESTLLVIDDDRSAHLAVSSQLEPLGYRILYASDPVEGIRLATVRIPDAILLDINMPKMDGLKVCRHLRETEATRDIPVIFVTVDREARQIARALDCGGSDYVLKPFEQVELSARVRVALRTKRMIDLLKQQARIDALTGLRNRAALDDALEAAVAAHQRTGQPAGLLMLDIDHFKQINDRYGHGVGDEVLRGVGAATRSCCRPYDMACRFGGDEFAVIFEQTDGAGAQQAARRALSQARSIEVIAAGGPVPVSVSGGLASTEELDPYFEAPDLLKAADSMLYRAKHAGRGRLEIYRNPA
jgi:diguanylate cyclase (GGDEF)-like protein